jgi:hypothetical protein
VWIVVGLFNDASLTVWFKWQGDYKRWIGRELSWSILRYYRSIWRGWEKPVNFNQYTRDLRYPQRLRFKSWFLGCDVVSWCGRILTFRITLLPSSSGWYYHIRTQNSRYPVRDYGWELFWVRRSDTHYTATFRSILLKYRRPAFVTKENLQTFLQNYLCYSVGNWVWYKCSDTKSLHHYNTSSLHLKLLILTVYHALRFTASLWRHNPIISGLFNSHQVPLLPPFYACFLDTSFTWLAEVNFSLLLEQDMC